MFKQVDTNMNSSPPHTNNRGGNQHWIKAFYWVGDHSFKASIAQANSNPSFISSNSIEF